MDSIERLKYLSQQMTFEFDNHPVLSVKTFTSRNHRNHLTPASEPYLDKTDSCPDSVFIQPAVMPNGQQIKLLKTLLSSACERDCFYCPFRAGRDFRRATFQPEEFARLFVSLYDKGIAEGIFLSSGMVGGSIRTQDRLIDTAEILRFKLGFKGYIHLKVMPGSEYAQVERAMQISNRVSVNLEAPNDERLKKLAPHKAFFDELLRPLRWIDDIRHDLSPSNSWNKRWPSSVTQFVAGGAGESDLELLSVTERLYRDLHLTRAYYSAFNPIPDTPLENHKATSPIREHRLYQASFLLRDYGFEMEEMPFEKNGMLPITIDPKLAWAQIYLKERPVEINNSARRDLLRVPGIGPKGADAIISVRKQTKILDISSLKKIGVIIGRAAPYILINGKSPSYQAELVNP